MPVTYADLLTAQRERESHVLQRFVTTQGTIERTGAQVFLAAQRRGTQLLGLGLSTQQRVALLVTDPAEFIPLLHGCLLYGLVPVPFYPPPLLGKRESHTAALAAVLAAADVQLVVVDDGATARFGHTFAACRTVELSALPETEVVPLPKLEPTQLALLQFTSGSTRVARGVCISHRALMANARAIMHDGLAATATDHGVCWLPLYHDMGLVGFALAPLLTQTPVTFIPTSRFIRNPNIWLQTLHDVRATITFAPNFAYALATKRGAARALDLRCVRMWGCGAEPISEHTLQTFEARYAESGVAPRSVAPCYGLAEATLAVTVTPARTPRRYESLDRDALTTLETASVSRREAVNTTGLLFSQGDTKNQNQHPTSGTACATLDVVSCGKPLPGYEIAIVDAEGRLLPDGRVGEIVVCGPSVSDGYHGQPEASEHTFRDDGLYTGDRGYLRQGELFVVGRLKETIVLNGRKYDAPVLEQVIEALPQVRRAVAVNVTSHDGDVLAIALERVLDRHQTDDSLAQTVRATLAAHFGVQTAHVKCTTPGTLPRTTSGKLQRNKVRELFASDGSVRLEGA